MTGSRRTDRLIGAAMGWAIAAGVVSVVAGLGPIQRLAGVVIVAIALVVYAVGVAICAAAANASSGDTARRTKDFFVAIAHWLAASRSHPVDPNAPRPIRYYAKKAATWRTEFSDETVERRENPVGLLKPRRGEIDDEELCRFANGVMRVALTNVISHGLETDVARSQGPPLPSA